MGKKDMSDQKEKTLNEFEKGAIYMLGHFGVVSNNSAICTDENLKYISDSLRKFYNSGYVAGVINERSIQASNKAAYEESLK